MRTYTKNFLRHKYLKKLAKQVTSSSLQWKIKKLLGVSNVIHTFRLGILIKKKKNYNCHCQLSELSKVYVCELPCMYLIYQSRLVIRTSLIEENVGVYFCC